MQRVMSRNGYSYVEGNPVNYADPSGRIAPLLAGILWVLGGTIARGVVGGVGGFIYAGVIYDLMAADGAPCGCDAKLFTQSISKADFQVATAVQGAFTGAVLGGIAAAGPIGLGAAALVGGAQSAWGGAEALRSIVDDIRAGRTVSACDAINLGLGIVGTAMGIAGVRQGYRNYQAQQLARIRQETDDARVDLSQRRTWSSYDDAPIIEVDPTELRFSQSTAGGRGRAAQIRSSMREHGWQGDPIDVVQTDSGLVTIDNTRAAIAQELGIENIPVRVHQPGSPLPGEMYGRFGDARTWGEALVYRTSRQSPPLPPNGTTQRPRLPPE